jgi:CRP/FNR family cyclic AMP-dependent transcriptional regulator
MNSSSTPASGLPASGFLADVSSEHRSFLACFGKFVRPSDGEVLIREGESQEALYFILSGTLHVVSSVNGRNLLLASFGEGESLGEINLFDPATASATAIVRTPGLIWMLTREELNTFPESDPAAGVAVLRGLLKQVARRVRGMNVKLISAEQKATLHNFWGSESE